MFMFTFYFTQASRRCRSIHITTSTAELKVISLSCFFLQSDGHSEFKALTILIPSKSEKTCSRTDRLHTVSDAPSGRTRVMVRSVWNLFWRKDPQPPKRSGRPGCRSLFAIESFENNQKQPKTPEPPDARRQAS